MNSFEPMFRLDIRHDYWAPHSPPLIAEPDEETRRFASLPSVRLRYGRGSVEGFCTTDRQALAMIAEEAPIALTFRLRATSDEVLTVTDVYAAGQNQTVVITATAPDSGTLHSGETVTASDLRSLKDPAFPLTASDLVARPFAVVSLTLDPGTVNRTWSIRFGAVERFWTYNVSGGAGDAKFSVNDTQDQHVFEQIDALDRPDGRVMRRFRSTTPIPARSRPDQRFELVNDGPFGRRVIIPVLPAASARIGAIDPSGTPPGGNTDIYVYL